MLWWTVGYTCLFQCWFPRCVCPAVGLLGHKAVLYPVFEGISTLFSIVAVLVCIPTNSVRGFPFLHTLASIYCLQTFGLHRHVSFGVSMWEGRANVSNTLNQYFPPDSNGWKILQHISAFWILWKYYLETFLGSKANNY